MLLLLLILSLHGLGVLLLRMSLVVRVILYIHLPPLPAVDDYPLEREVSVADQLLEVALILLPLTLRGPPPTNRSAILSLNLLNLFGSALLVRLQF